MIAVWLMSAVVGVTSVLWVAAQRQNACTRGSGGTRGVNLGWVRSDV